MLSSIDYAALVQYSPRGTSDVSVRSRRARDIIKSGQDRPLADLAQRLSQALASGQFPGWFENHTTLIPVPRSAPLRDKDAFWGPLKICEALIAAGVGSDISTCLSRVHAVKKSAFQARGERPMPQAHYDSFVVDTSLFSRTEEIILIDDFISRGRTLIAAATRVSEAYPVTRLRAFAMVRTRGRDEVDSILKPFVGQVIFDENDANRSD